MIVFITLLTRIMIYVAAIRVSQLLFGSEDGSIAGFLADPSSGLTWPRASSTHSLRRFQFGPKSLIRLRHLYYWTDRYKVSIWRHLRYFVAIGEEQHYGRAARSLRVAQPALSRQIQDLEEELGFKLFERLPRGVKLSAAGKLFLEDARRILQEVNEATMRAAQVARGLSGTLRVGFSENASWRGVVPDSFRRFREQQPDAKLQLQPAASLAQYEAIRSGRLDAGFVNFMPKSDPELDQLCVAMQHVELAVPKRHPLTKLKKLRLRDLTDVPFVWFPRWASPAFYDRLMRECYRGGLKSPRIAQEGLNEATILSLVATGLGVGWVIGTARWRSPETIVILPVVDLDMPLALSLVWRRDNTSPLLANFISELQRLPGVRAVNKG